MLLGEQQRGAPPAVIAQKAAEYWLAQFPDFSGKIRAVNPQAGELGRLSDSYDRRTQFSPPPDSEQIENVTDEAATGAAISGVGQIANDPNGTLRALHGAFGISLAASNGRKITELLSVLSNQKQPTPSDLLVFRIFAEGQSGIGDNTFKLTDDERRYTPADFARLAELAKYPNPVARLIAVEMLQYIPNAKEDATPELAAMIRGMANEEEPAVIKRLIERANRQRSKVYEEVLRELSKRVEESNPKLKDAAQRVMKAIEETPTSP